MRARVLLILATTSALLACGQPARPVPPGDLAVPAPRTGASAAYDPATRDIVMFGGTNRLGALGETWTWDGSAWRQMQPATAPPPRQDAVMAFDPSSNRLILFGGVTCGPFQPDDLIGCDGTELLSDTWAWDGATWSRVGTSHHPQVDHFDSERVNAGTDEKHRQLILVAHAQGDRDDRVQTWSFDQGDWRLLNPLHVPHLWDFSGPQFDATSGRFVILQGPVPHFDCGTAPCSHDFQEGMWSWSGSDWQMLSSSIPPDLGSLLRTARGLMLFGEGGQYLWNGSSWDAGAALPWGDTLRDGWAGAYDTPRHTLVVYGGQAFESNHLFGDTLGWDGRSWMTLAPAPPSAPPSPLPRCGTRSPSWSFSIDVGGGSVWMDEPLSGPCHLKAAGQFALLGPSGQLLQVKGNPSTVNLDQDLTYGGGTIEVSFLVGGACGLPANTTARISVGEWQESSTRSARPCEGSPAPIAITSSVQTIKN